MVTQLKDIVIEMREKYPHLSWESLAHYCGIQGKTLKGIYDGSVVRPSFTSVWGICLFHFKTDMEKARSALIDFFPNKQKLINRDINLVQKNKENYSDLELNTIIANRYRWHVFSITTDVNEVHLEKFKKQGIKYYLAATELVQEGLLTLKNDILSPKTNFYSIGTFDERIKVSQFIIENIKELHSMNKSDPESVLGVKCGGLSDRGIELVHDEDFKYWEAISNIYKDHPGTNPHGTIILSSKYDLPTEIDEDQK